MRGTYTAEQQKWLEVNYPLLGKDCVDDFNRIFKTNKKAGTLREWCRRRGIYVNEDVTYQKRSCIASQMKPKRKYEVGDIWKESNSGYLLIKVSERCRTKRKSDSIKYYHRYLWEREYGTIPDGYDVNFLDGNKENCSIENLVCIPKSVETTLSACGVRSEDKEVTKTAIKWCELYMALKKEK